MNFLASQFFLSFFLYSKNGSAMITATVMMGGDNYDNGGNKVMQYEKYFSFFY